MKLSQIALVIGGGCNLLRGTAGLPDGWRTSGLGTTILRAM